MRWRIVHGGVDFVIAQGHEAGGHTGEITTMVLVPQVVDAVAPLAGAGRGRDRERAPGRRRDGAGGGRRVVRLGVADDAGIRGGAAAEEATCWPRAAISHGALAGDLGQAGAHAALGRGPTRGKSPDCPGFLPLPHYRAC
jgi:hypothetical protein